MSGRGKKQLRNRARSGLGTAINDLRNHWEKPTRCFGALAHRQTTTSVSVH